MRFAKSAIVLALTVLILSCATTPITVPNDLSPMELIQRGQEASDRNRFAHALQYYEVLIERYPLNIDYICAAEYEIAFIHYKQRNFDLSRSMFNNLLERYNGPGGQMLPPQFEILSHIVLERIDEEEARRNIPFFRRR
ncbi:MAG: hypothetical protein FWG77_06285 [Treponema sp.]|nr:hypothetical protein [Treponema sp.]